MSPTILATTEEALEHLGQHQPSNDRFELAVKDGFTWKGKPDVIGLGMALILRKILAMGYEPDGFEQKDGFRLYQYKKMKQV